MTVREGQGIEIRSGISGLLVLKSTGSQFHGFLRDEFTTLGETWDRILSTEIDNVWAWKNFPTLSAVRAFVPKFDKAWEDARAITLKLFAEENSPSVQNTMYKMSEKILEAVPDVVTVEYSLPNKHYFDIGWFPHTLISIVTNEFSRSELLQRSQEYGCGHDCLCSPIRTKWPDQVHCRT